jgi:uncharacterized protein (DUF433 family)
MIQWMTAPDKPKSTAIPASPADVTDGQRRLLPHDLGRALQYASDEELRELREAVQQEMKRRNLPLDPVPEVKAKNKSSQADNSGHDLTRSQISLVQASIQAGVKPAVLARQFGISLADIRAVLAQR